MFDPVAARAQLERRLELGGWFTGAVFAVGGSLWGTNLFWGDIPAALRPAVVGMGLAVFAAAFIAVGAVLAVRHAASVAGRVLGLVGRLIAVSSVFPLGLLWKEAGSIALVVDVVVVAALWAAMRFGARKAQAGAAEPAIGTVLFLVGFAIAVAAPAGEIWAFVVGGLALGLLRASISRRTDDALAGRPTWVNDISALALCAAALVSDRAGFEGAGSTVGVALFACFADTVARLFEQRPGLFGVRMLVRWSVAIVVVVLACVAVEASLDHEEGLGFAAVVLFLAASWFAVPEALGLPRAFRCLFAAGAALAAGFLTAAVQLAGGIEFDDIGVLAVFVGVLALFAATTRERRAPHLGLGEKLATLTLFLIALPVAAGAGDDVGAVPAVLVVLALYVSDRRAERSVWWCLLAVSVLLTALGKALGATTLSEGVQGTLGVSLLALVVVAGLVVRSKRPTWPVIAGISAALLFVLGFGAGAVAKGLDGEPLWAVAWIAALTLLVCAELVRSVDLAGWGALVLAPLGVWELHHAFQLGPWLAGAVVVVVIALLSFAPQLPPPVPALRSRRLLAHSLTWWGRSSRARALALFRVAAVGAVGVAVTGLAGRISAVDVVGVLPGMALAVLLLAARAPTSGMLAALGLALALAVGDLASARVVDDVVVGGLAALAALVCFALIAAVLRAAAVRLPVITRLVRRRGRRVSARDPLWGTVAAAGVTAALAAAVGVLLVADRSADDAVGFAMLLGLLAGLHAWALFAARAVQPLVSLGAISFAAVPAFGFARALGHDQDTVALGFALALVVVLVLYAVVARLLYSRRSWGARPWWLLERWPRPVTFRAVSLSGLAAVASTLAGFGLLVRVLGTTGTPLAERLGPVVVVVVVALLLAALIALRTRRTLGAGLVVLAICGLAGGAFDMTAHAALWLPKSHGLGEASGGLGIVAIILLLNRRRGRRLLVAARLALPRVARAGMVNALVVAAPLLVGLALLLSMGDAPTLHAPEMWLASLALVLLVAVEPRPALGWLGASGVLLVTASSQALLVRGEVLTTSAAPWWLAGMMAACLALQSFVAKVWANRLVVGFHKERAAHLPAVAAALRRSAEGAAFILLVGLLWLTIVDEQPTSAALMSTWIGMGLAVVLFSRVAQAQEQTVLAAFAQGIALSVYVDVRRRTPWLDDLPGADAVFLLAAAVAFLALRALARSRDAGSSVARAAEAYAVTLPLLAAALGPSSGARALILMVGGGLYAVLARSRRLARYELAAGAALVAACMLALVHAGVRAPESYLLPVAFVGTFLARRHRRLLGPSGRSLAVMSHVPLYCTAAWSALRTETFGSFAVGIGVTTMGVVYAMRVRDRRSLYAAASAALVLVGGRLILAGLDNAVLGTLLLAGVGIALLAGMTVFTIKRDVAAAALKGASSRLDHWNDDD